MFSGFFGDGARLAAVRAIVARVAEKMDLACSLRLWDGSLLPLGRSADPAIYIAISGPGVISSLIRQPSLDNLVQHYAAGRISFQGTDLVHFAEILRARKSRLKVRELGVTWLARQAVPFLFCVADRSVISHAASGEGVRTPQSDNQALIKFHYDIGNDFYQLFLDPEMQYSCAYFTDWNNSLEQAQLDKLDLTCRKLRLQPGDRMLDIGCGWGGLSCHAAKSYGAQVTGVTLSEQQLAFCQAKIQRLGLQDRVKVELRDYATLDGTFDKISSIEMYEHVGISNFPSYFGKLHSLLRPNGILVNQGSTRCPRAPGKKVRQEEKLIQKYIFPGGELDHIGHTVQSVEQSRFMVHDVENWREHFAQTTRHWSQRLSARSAEAIAMVGVERYRMWLAYLTGVSCAFTDGSLSVFQIVATKQASKGLSGLPPTREGLYQRVPRATRQAA